MNRDLLASRVRGYTEIHRGPEQHLHHHAATSYNRGMKNDFRRRFGLMMAGIGAGVAAISLLTDSLDGAQITASTLLVVAGLILFFVS